MKNYYDILIHKGYLTPCPWNSITLITHTVPVGHRYNTVLDEYGLYQLDLTPIFNTFKTNYYTKGYIFTYGRAQAKFAYQPGDHDGWTVYSRETYTTIEGKILRPYSDGFLFALKHIEKYNLIQLSVAKPLAWTRGGIES